MMLSASVTCTGRSTKESWLQGPGDLKEADVEDVPVAGESVRVRGLPAKFSAEIQAQLKLVQQGREQVAKIDVESMERLQFTHGVIEPVFSEQEAALIQERYGPAFRKVIEKIDELSGMDKEAIEAAEKQFPAGGGGAGGPVVANGAAVGGAGPDLPVRVGVGTADADQ
jgi:hypothetical protein